MLIVAACYFKIIVPRILVRTKLAKWPETYMVHTPTFYFFGLFIRLSFWQDVVVVVGAVQGVACRHTSGGSIWTQIPLSMANAAATTVSILTYLTCQKFSLDSVGGWKNIEHFLCSQQVKHLGWRRPNNFYYSKKGSNEVNEIGSYWLFVHISLWFGIKF